MSTGSWSELRAEHEVRYTGVERFLVITMSKTSGVAEGLYGLVVGTSGLKIRQEFASALRSAKSRRKGGHVRSDQWAGSREVGRKDYHRFTGQSDLDSSSLQVGQARNGH